jgi:hypothetical protein
MTTLTKREDEFLTMIAAEMNYLGLNELTINNIKTASDSINKRMWKILHTPEVKEETMKKIGKYVWKSVSV